MVVLGNYQVSLADFNAILFKADKVALSNNAIKKVERSFSFLRKFSKDKLIYGLNTGFGPMAQYRVDEKNIQQLQFNLIRSHCSGSGNLLSPNDIKAMMVARLNAFLYGYSGINKEVVILLKEMINHDIFPCIYEHGGVGASGDLVQLAHLALSMIGEGDVIFKNQIIPTQKVFKRINLKPIHIHLREGLAILNGTSAMSGIGVVNLIYSKKLLEWSIIFSAMINEIVQAFDDHCSSELNDIKAHSGQKKVAAEMRKILSGSKRSRSRTEHFYNDNNGDWSLMDKKLQECYSLRCAPQILGPVNDTIESAEQVVINEINSVNDNPIIDVENQNIFHGCNFHGDYVSLEMDKLKLSITKLTMLAERQLNFLLNDKLNQKLPPFINLGTLGLNYGMQGLQFTATSTTAENQTLSGSMYIHSIPNNNDNQDIVSNGTNAALITRRVIENSFEVLAIQAFAVVQAIEYLKCQKTISPFNQNIFKLLKKIIPVLIPDRATYNEIKKVKNLLKIHELNILS